MPQLMSAAISEPSMDPVDSHNNQYSAQATHTDTVAMTSTVDSMLYHLQACIVCRQELLLAAAEDRYVDDRSSAALMEIVVSALSHCLRSQTPGLLDHITNQDQHTCTSDVEQCEPPLSQRLPAYECHQVKDKDRPRPMSPHTSSSIGNVGEPIANFTTIDASPIPDYEPLLKRQNAFEHISTQASFDSTSAADTEWLMDGEADDFCDDGSPTTTTGAWLTPTIGLKSLPIFDLPLRQNAFEIPSGVSEQDWSRYI